jgi:predicted Zn-dependent protease
MKVNVAKHASVGVLALLIASGCATTGEQSAPDAVAQQLDAYIADDGNIQHDISNREVAARWRESEDLRTAGDYSGARAKLQQAIEVTPRDPVLWSRAAELELELAENLRAENYAAKSNFLTPEANQGLRYRNWLLIERAREARGDLLGAREAQIEARKYNQ